MTEQYSFTIKYPQIVNQIRSSIKVFEDCPTEEAVENASNYIAVWDTGAKITTISNRLVEALGLERNGGVTVRTVNGTRERSLYSVGILLPMGTYTNDIRVMAGELDGFDVLIGMDVISQGEMSILNGGGCTAFTFRLPPSDPVPDEPEMRNADKYFAFPVKDRCYVWKYGYSKFKAILQILLGK